jgi:hypothetical protein
MHHSAALILTLPGDAVLREPSSWERVKRLFLPASRAPDLNTEERQLDRNVVSLTEGICDALRGIDVTDAVYLAVDGQAVYHDLAGVPNDAEKLLEAAQQGALGGPFEALRAVFVQREEGLDLLYEATFKRRFFRDTPTAFLAVSGRIGALRPHAGEPIEAAQARLHTVLSDAELLPSLRAFFDERVERLRDSLSRAFPEANVTRRPTTTFIRRPSKDAIRRLSRRGLAEPQPSLRAQPGCYHPSGTADRYYDPYDCYFLDDAQIWINLATLDELVEGFWHPVPAMAVEVIDSAGELLCHATAALGQGNLLSEVISFAAQRDISTLDYFAPSASGPVPHASLDADPFTTTLTADSAADAPPDFGVSELVVNSDVSMPGIINVDSPMPGIVLPDHPWGPGDSHHVVSSAIGDTIGNLISDVLSALLNGVTSGSSDYNPWDD